MHHFLLRWLLCCSYTKNSFSVWFQDEDITTWQRCTSSISSKLFCTECGNEALYSLPFLFLISKLCFLLLMLAGRRWLHHHIKSPTARQPDGWRWSLPGGENLPLCYLGLQGNYLRPWLHGGKWRQQAFGRSRCSPGYVALFPIEADAFWCHCVDWLSIIAVASISGVCEKARFEWLRHSPAIHPRVNDGSRHEGLTLSQVFFIFKVLNL